MSNDNIKPVFLDADKCNGCVSCMKRCPTEAIRVRGGKATIAYDRCVGCGECVKICPTHAKKEFYDKFEKVSDAKYKYKVALPSPSIYGQFNNLKDVNYILTGLKRIGFDDVFEVGASAEIVSAATREYLKRDVPKPIISTACPAITNLILMRYEHLIEHLSPLKQPEEIAIELATAKAVKDSGLKREQIGIFVITQCAAKVVALKDKCDGVLSFKEIYFPLLAEMNKIGLGNEEKLTKIGKLGLSWGCSTGEAVGIGTNNFLAADGIENVFSVLNELEHDKLTGLDFLDLNACASGCVGGSMNIENPFLARTRLRLLRNNTEENTKVDSVGDIEDYFIIKPYESNNVFKLDDNRIEAMKKMVKVKDIYSRLPQLDCGSCGAPSCMALAEDIVKGMNVKCKYTEAEDYAGKRNSSKA